jgi:hypothetical protein
MKRQRISWGQQLRNSCVAVFFDRLRQPDNLPCVQFPLPHRRFTALRPYLTAGLPLSCAIASYKEPSCYTANNRIKQNGVLSVKSLVDGYTGLGLRGLQEEACKLRTSAVQWPVPPIFLTSLELRLSDSGRT